jgi:hypothetical protein
VQSAGGKPTTRLGNVSHALFQTCLHGAGYTRYSYNLGTIADASGLSDNVRFGSDLNTIRTGTFEGFSSGTHPTLRLSKALALCNEALSSTLLTWIKKRQVVSAFQYYASTHSLFRWKTRLPYNKNLYQSLHQQIRLCIIMYFRPDRWMFE